MGWLLDVRLNIKAQLSCYSSHAQYYRPFSAKCLQYTCDKSVRYCPWTQQLDISNLPVLPSWIVGPINCCDYSSGSGHSVYCLISNAQHCALGYDHRLHNCMVFSTSQYPFGLLSSFSSMVPSSQGSSLPGHIPQPIVNAGFIYGMSFLYITL